MTDYEQHLKRLEEIDLEYEKEIKKIDRKFFIGAVVIYIIWGFGVLLILKWL